MLTNSGSASAMALNWKSDSTADQVMGSLVLGTLNGQTRTRIFRNSTTYSWHDVKNGFASAEADRQITFSSAQWHG